MKKNTPGFENKQTKYFENTDAYHMGLKHSYPAFAVGTTLHENLGILWCMIQSSAAQ